MNDLGSERWTCPCGRNGFTSHLEHPTARTEICPDCKQETLVFKPVGVSVQAAVTFAREAFDSPAPEWEKEVGGAPCGLCGGTGKILGGLGWEPCVCSF